MIRMDARDIRSLNKRFDLIYYLGIYSSELMYREETGPVSEMIDGLSRVLCTAIRAKYMSVVNYVMETLANTGKKLGFRTGVSLNVGEVSRFAISNSNAG